MTPELLQKILQKAKEEAFVDQVFSPYNKGEPLLHPQLREIFDVVRASGLRLAISSNLIRLPHLDSAMLGVIQSFDVSLSGFSNETYKLNHKGGEIQKVLSNILHLRDLRDSAGLSFPITVKWHRYRYNEHEAEDARTFFLDHGILFAKYYAFFGAAKEFEEYFGGSYPADQRKLVEERIFVDVIDHSIERHQNNPSCALRDLLTIDESGQVLLCCAYANTRDSIIGDYLSLARHAIVAAKGEKTFCTKCMACGWAGFFAAGE